MTVTVLGTIEQVPLTITISSIEVLALKKLALIGHMLADKMDHSPRLEQRAIVGTLDDIIRRFEVARLRGGPKGAPPGPKKPNAVTFSIPGGDWVLRLTKDGGIESNPAVTTDEGAKALFEALKPHLQALAS